MEAVARLADPRGLRTTVDTLTIAVLAGLAFLLVLILALLIVLLLRRPAESGVVVGPLQSLTQSIGVLQSEARTLAERLAAMERGQAKVGEDVAAVSTRLVHTGTLTQGLTDATASIREGLASAQETLSAPSRRRPGAPDGWKDIVNG